MIHDEFQRDIFLRAMEPYERMYFIATNKLDFITPTVLLIAAASTAGGVAAYGAYQQGQEAEKLAKARAAASIEAANQAEADAAEKAKIEEEKGIKLLKRQKILFSASGLRSNVGAPLVIAADTRRDIQLEKGFIMKRGRRTARNYRLDAAYEKAYGRAQKSASRWNMVTGLINTGVSTGSMAYNAGMFNKPGVTAGQMKQMNTRALDWMNTPFIY